MAKPLFSLPNDKEKKAVWPRETSLHNSITAKPTGLIFSLFDVASPREVPFGIPQYVQCILHGLTGLPHSSLLTAKGVDLAVARDGFPSKRKSSVFFIVAILIVA